MSRTEPSRRDLYLTAFADLNASIFFTQERLQEVEKTVEREFTTASVFEWPRLL
jgi:hypothetical protein